MNLHVHLQAVGVLQVLLALMHLALPRRFNWKAEMSRLSLLNRQIFYVHTFFICFVLLLFGLLNLVCADELLAPGRLARTILIGITTFWVIRWLFQLFVYDARLWKGNRFNTLVHISFTLMWTYFIAVYSLAVWRQFDH